MIVVTVMYPNTPGSKFETDYYLNTHAQLVGKHWNDRGLEQVELVSGIAGGGPDEPAAYQVMAILRFSSLDAFQDCLANGGEEIMGDIPNFTDVQPILQISEPLQG